MQIHKLLVDLGFPVEVRLAISEAYNGETRFYHNERHILKMLQYFEDFMTDNPSHPYRSSDIMAMQYAIIMHDYVYDVRAKDNEEKSLIAALNFESQRNGGGLLPGIDIPLVSKLIMATKSHEYDRTASEFDLCNLIIEADLQGFNQPDFNDVWQDTVNIFKEYYFVDWTDFKIGRINFLKEYRHKIYGILGSYAALNVDKIAERLGWWQPKVGIMAGSFNPFHVGHLNILHKAEQIFDKIIIAVGKNPDKPDSNHMISEYIRNRYQVDSYDSLLTDYFATKDYPVSLVRGLRNTTDLSFEMNQYRFLQDFNKDISVVYLICDKEYEHISSTAIRQIKKFNKDVSDYEI